MNSDMLIALMVPTALTARSSRNSHRCSRDFAVHKEMYDFYQGHALRLSASLSKGSALQQYEFSRYHEAVSNKPHAKPQREL